MRCASPRLSIPIVCLFLLVPGLRAQAKEYPWEAAVENERRSQDRMIQRAETKKEPLEGVVRYYKQKLANEGSPLAHYLLGRVYGKTGDMELSIRHMDEARSRQPDFYHAWYSLAVLYAEKQDVQRARPFLDQALTLQPDYEPALRLLQKFHMAAQDWKALKAGCEALLRKNAGDMEARYHLAVAYMGGKEYKQAKYLLEKLVASDPRAINVRMLWVECALALEQWAEAEKELQQLGQAFPKDPYIKEKLVETRLNSGDSEGAAKVLREMIAAQPDEPRLRGLLAQTLLMLKDLPGAERELDFLQGLIAKDEKLEAMRPWVLRMLSFIYAQTERDDEAVRTLAALDALEKLPPNLLDMWQVTLAKLGRHQERIPVLQRLLPFLEGQPEGLAKVQALITALEAGEASPDAEPGMFGADQLGALIERCTSPDVNVRRKALYEYYELDLPFADPVIYHRHDPRIEPDPECRLWVVKILGRFPAGRAQPDIVRIAARYAGYALEDPDAKVRQAAATALGSILAPAGTLYLRAHIGALRKRLEQLPEGREDREALEREVNAVRTALRAVTGHNDVAIGENDWVPLAEASKSLVAWDAWLDTEAGALKRVEGIEDLGAIDDIDPRWHLRYILADVIQDKPPAPLPVALAAYRILRDRIRGLPAARRDGDPWWKTFPVFPDDKLAAAHLPEIRAAVKSWWASLPKRGGR